MLPVKLPNVATNKVKTGSPPAYKTVRNNASEANGMMVADKRHPINNPQYESSKSKIINELIIGKYTHRHTNKNYL